MIKNATQMKEQYPLIYQFLPKLQIWVDQSNTTGSFMMSNFISAGDLEHELREIVFNDIVHDFNSITYKRNKKKVKNG